jgi:hypothetical protein
MLAGTFDPDFHAACAELKAALQLNTAQFVTLMSSSVAARATDADFREALVELKTSLGPDAAQFVTFIGDARNDDVRAVFS